MRGALQAGASPGPRPQLLGPPRRCPTPPHCCSLSPVPVSRPGPRWLQALPSQGALGQHPSWAVPWLRWLCPGHFFLRALPGSDRGQDEGTGPAEGTCVSKTEGEEGKRGNRAPGAGVEDKPMGGSAGRVLAMQCPPASPEPGLRLQAPLLVPPCRCLTPHCCSPSSPLASLP